MSRPQNVKYYIMQRPEYKRRMMEARNRLPIFEKKNEIVDIIKHNQVVVVSGEIACGKTTQVPQYILDDALTTGENVKILCTQPRKISAITVAERVAAERSEVIGDSVGYHVRVERRTCKSPRSILYCTTGVLLQFMKGKNETNFDFLNYTHIILDDIHERNSMSDFTVALMKQVIAKKSKVKIILMSATIHFNAFTQYYGNCPTIHVPGIVQPVTDYYLEDILELTKYTDTPANYQNIKRTEAEKKYFEEVMQPELKVMMNMSVYSQKVIHELRVNPVIEPNNVEVLLQLLKYICTTKGPGAILIFQPGFSNLLSLRRNLYRAFGEWFPRYSFQIFLLHSRFPMHVQKRAFKTLPPNMRKIIIATSIAEASITIPDVKFVIDCGEIKLTRYDATRNLEVLASEWESIANAKQRRGRTGRVQPGECYYLHTRIREGTFTQYPTPQIQRSLLQEEILQTKLLKLGNAYDFFKTFMDPPSVQAVNLSLELLRDQNAINDDENLTPYGRRLAELSFDPKIGKMLLWGSVFSCIEPILAIAAVLSFKDPYSSFGSSFFDKEEENKIKTAIGYEQFSDHIVFAQALMKYKHAKNKDIYCRSNNLCKTTMNLLQNIIDQFAFQLHKMKYLCSNDPRDERDNVNSRNLALIKAIVCAGQFPNIALAQSNKQNVYNIIDSGPAVIYNSINAHIKSHPTPYITYYSTLMHAHNSKSNHTISTCLYQTTFVTDAVLAFANINYRTHLPDTSECNKKRSEFINEKITPYVKKMGLERKLNNVYEILEEKFAHPGVVKWDAEDGLKLHEMIDFITHEDEVYDIRHYVKELRIN